jgi:transcriptional regulator
MSDQTAERDLKKGSAELLVLALLEARQRHGYEISKLIETRSEGRLKFRVASLYPLLYKLEERGWIQGRWVERSGQRRRRYYRITTAGKKMLLERRSLWAAFVESVRNITEGDYA